MAVTSNMFDAISWAIRERLDITQLQLSGFLGVNRSTVCRWENCSNIPDETARVLLKAIYEQLQTKADWEVMECKVYLDTNRKTDPVEQFKYVMKFLFGNLEN